MINKIFCEWWQKKSIFFIAEYFSNFHFYFFSICSVVLSTILFSNYIKAWEMDVEAEAGDELSKRHFKW